MAITSMKPVKAKNKAQVYDGRMTEKAKKVGFTDAEARGIFGSSSSYRYDGSPTKKKVVVIRDRDKQKAKRKSEERRNNMERANRKLAERGLVHEPTEAEMDNIRDYERRHAEAELKRYKRINSDIPVKMGERQAKAMAKILELDR